VVEDVSRTKPYDLLASKDGAAVSVEVKGTTTAADSVLLTKNEVDHARNGQHEPALYILHSVRLSTVDGVLTATDGTPAIHWPWNVDSGQLVAMQFKYLPTAPNWPNTAT
jgi:hypothetical protein